MTTVIHTDAMGCIVVVINDVSKIDIEGSK